MFLPYSNRRYWFNDDNILCSKENLIIENGRVNIAWINGPDSYNMDLLLLLTFSPPALNVDHWCELEVVYLDGNVENNTVSNLSYRFKNGPLEVETMPGYFYIPGYSRYAISRELSLVNVETRSSKIWSFTKPNLEKNSTGGYAYSRLVADDGESVTVFRHRLALMTFIGYPNGCEALVVNHLNGIPGDDRLENLVWTTYSENNFHAYSSGLRKNASRPIEAKDLKTGLCLKFESVSECARHYGYDSGTFIYFRMKTNPSRVYSDYLQFKYCDMPDWPVPDFSKVYPVGGGCSCAAKNILTGEVTVAESRAKLAEFLGLSTQVVVAYVARANNTPYKGFIFRDLTSDVEWPLFSDEIINILRNNGCKWGTMVIAYADGNEVTRGTAVDVADELGLTKGQVFSALKRNGKVANYTFKKVQ